MGGIEGDRRMIKKYTRRLINQKATLHDLEFVAYDDVERLLTDILNAAVEAGADEVRLMEVFDNE